MLAGSTKHSGFQARVDDCYGASHAPTPFSNTYAPPPSSHGARPNHAAAAARGCPPGHSSLHPAQSLPSPLRVVPNEPLYTLSQAASILHSISASSASLEQIALCAQALGTPTAAADRDARQAAGAAGSKANAAHGGSGGGSGGSDDDTAVFGGSIRFVGPPAHAPDTPNMHEQRAETAATAQRSPSLPLPSPSASAQAPTGANPRALMLTQLLVASANATHGSSSPTSRPAPCTPPPSATPSGRRLQAPRLIQPGAAQAQAAAESHGIGSVGAAGGAATPTATVSSPLTPAPPSQPKPSYRIHLPLAQSATGSAQGSPTTAGAAPPDPSTTPQSPHAALQRGISRALTEPEEEEERASGRIGSGALTVLEHTMHDLLPRTALRPRFSYSGTTTAAGKAVHTVTDRWGGATAAGSGALAVLASKIAAREKLNPSVSEHQAP